MTSHLPLVAVSLLALAPLALAESTSYVGPGRISTGMGAQALLMICDPGVGAGFGGGCSFDCPGFCNVTVTDAFGAPQAFRVCSWDGMHDRDCVDSEGPLDYIGNTELVDVFVANGVFGTITVQ